jgi:3',5'-nucleoside bisphosphate phosphatase
MDYRADLHCHSNFSDGTCSPIEILELAQELGLKGISITDHDTIAAYDEMFFDKAKELGIDVLQGVEISTEYEDELVHILAYNVSSYDTVLLKFLESVRERKYYRNKSILKKLSHKGFLITEDDLDNFVVENNIGITTIGRPHIASVMVDKGYVATIQTAFDKYLKEGASCYARNYKFDSRDVIEKIHEVGGIAIIAHPHIIKRRKVVKDLLQLPFDGLEGYYNRLSHHEEKKWIDIAEKKEWVVTGGSDFHGKIKPHVSLGCSWVTKEVFIKLQNFNVRK